MESLVDLEKWIIINGRPRTFAFLVISESKVRRSGIKAQIPIPYIANAWRRAVEKKQKVAYWQSEISSLERFHSCRDHWPRPRAISYSGDNRAQAVKDCNMQFVPNYKAHGLLAKEA